MGKRNVREIWRRGERKKGEKGPDQDRREKVVGLEFKNSLLCFLEVCYF